MSELTKIETSDKPRIIFGDIHLDSNEATFTTDHLPNVDTYRAQQIPYAYISAFEIAINNSSDENSLTNTMQRLHADALGEVNWKKTIAELEGAEYATNSNYQSGDLRRGMPTRLTFAYAAKGVVYDAPMPEQSIEILGDLDALLNKQVSLIKKTSDDYFDLAATISIVTFLSHPFLGGNKRVIRPLITNILTRGGLVGRWLEGDEKFINDFKETWSNQQPTRQSRGV